MYESQPWMCAAYIITFDQIVENRIMYKICQFNSAYKKVKEQILDLLGPKSIHNWHSFKQVLKRG